jgi:hypothetical protein
MTIIDAPAHSTEVVQIPSQRGRRLAAFLLLAGPVLMLLAALTPAANDAEGVAKNPTAADLANFAQLLSVIFMLGYAAVIFITTRRTSPIASAIAMVATVCQLVALAVVTGWQIQTMTLVKAGVPVEQLSVEEGMSVSLIVTFILFLPTLLVSFIAGAVAMWRSGWAPRAVPVLMIAILIADVALPSDPAYYHMAVFALLIVVAGLLAAAILRDGATVRLPVGENVGS